jgi:hypothetical protein
MGGSAVAAIDNIIIMICHFGATTLCWDRIVDGLRNSRRRSVRTYSARIFWQCRFANDIKEKR